MPNPVLKPSVRLKKYAYRVFAQENFSGFEQMLLPLEAVMLTMLDGGCSKEEIAEGLADFLGLNSEKAAGFADKVFKKCAPFIDETGKCTFTPRYEPEDFVYDADLKAKPPRRFETPSEMILMLTYECNFRCVYCYNASAKRDPSELSTDEWLSLIRQMSEMGVIRVVVSGGEPTLHPGCMEILRELKARDMFIDFYTNGSKISDELLDVLQGGSVQLSLDSGGRETFKTMTGGIDAYETVLANMRRVTERGIQLDVYAVMTSMNAGNIGALYNACAACGAASMQLGGFGVSPGGRGDVEAQNKLALSDGQKVGLVTQLRAAKQAKPSEMRTASGLRSDVWHGRGDITCCGAFIRNMIILPNGGIACCERMPEVPDMLFGNVRQNTLLELWKQPRITEFFRKREETADPKCSVCAYLKDCQTGCFAIKHFSGKRGDELYLRDQRCQIKN